MAVSLKHATVATGTDAGNGEIAKAQWNEEHALTGTADTLLGFDGSGDAEEIAKPAGDLVGTTATQTLTNKTLTEPVLTGYTETVFALTGTTPAISAANGTIQTWALTGNSTPTDGLSNGQSVLLMIDDGSSRTITWTMVDFWETGGGTAPTLKTAGYTHVLLWKVDGDVYGALIGDPA